MANKQTGRSKDRTRDGFVYLTKRMVLRKAKSAGKVAAKNAMELMGYVVTVKEGWVVKEYKDGNFEKLEKLHDA